MLYRFNDVEKVLPVRGGDGKTFVTVNGKIKNEVMDDLPLQKNDKGELVIQTLFLNEFKEHRVIDIITTHFKFMDHFSVDLLKNIESFPIDGNQENTHPGNLGYRFKNGKLSYKERDGFFYIPGFPRRAINENGDIVSTLSNELLKWYVTKPQEYKNITGGYYTNRVEVNGKARIMLRHRSLLMTFRKYPNNCDQLITNHIDGIPGNDNLDNLEWVDHKGNLNHSYKNNLRRQNKPVIARNIFTGKELMFHSVAGCARHLKMNDRSINFKLEKCKFSSICKEGYQFKYVEDDRDWIIPPDPQLALKACFQNQKVLVKDIIDKDEKLCNSMSIASSLTGVSIYRISKQLKSNSIEPINGFIFLNGDY